jgi:FkbM family methyltransferase
MCLQKTVSYNKWHNVKLYNLAVGEKSGQVLMHSNDNSSVSDVSVLSEDLLEIRMICLDSFLDELHRCDLIKIDIEGYEFKALKGASGLIDKFRPELLIEVHPQSMIKYGDDVEDLIEFIENKKYKITYFNFLSELRLNSSLIRIINRYRINKHIVLKSKDHFLNDISIMPFITSYHLYCEPQ